jgi:DNA repair protein radc
VDYTMKDLPESERPRERLESQGVESLSDAEVLAIILRTGTQGLNVREMCSNILSEYDFDQLPDVSVEALKDFEGVSRVKAGQLKAAAELGRRMQRTSRRKIENLSDVRDETEDMRHLNSEVLRVFYLSAGNEVLAREDVDGGVSSVSFEVEEVLREAVRRKASGIILAHNHPSGRDGATDGDIRTTRRLMDAAEPLGIEVLDHVVLGSSAVSMRESTDLGF